MDEIRLEDGYLVLANKLVEVMYCYNFNATQIQILLFVIRFTYGFKRKSHKISISFISKGTGISRRSIGQELRNLIENNVLIIKEDHTATESREISINKNYKSWLGYGSRVPLWKESSTVEAGFHSGMEASFHSGMEASFHQESKTKLKRESKSTYTDVFEDFYRLYPNPKNKGQTFENWKKLIKVHDPTEIIKSAEKYKKSISPETDKKYITTSYNFLGQKAVYKEFLPGNSDDMDQARKLQKKIVEKVLSQKELEELFEEKRKKESEEVWGA